jgi:hypothetical protein
MRTTLTLDNDVAALLKRVMSRKQRGLKDVVNDALRDGLTRQLAPRSPNVPFETQARDLGRSLVPSFDNIAQVLALSEGDDYK